MNITFLIGNGFDLNLNLNTRYSDFYKYYIENDPQDIISKSIRGPTQKLVQANFLKILMKVKLTNFQIVKVLQKQCFLNTYPQRVKG